MLCDRGRANHSNGLSRSSMRSRPLMRPPCLVKVERTPAAEFLVELSLGKHLVELVPSIHGWLRANSGTWIVASGPPRRWPTRRPAGADEARGRFLPCVKPRIVVIAFRGDLLRSPSVQGSLRRDRRHHDPVQAGRSPAAGNQTRFRQQGNVINLMEALKNAAWPTLRNRSGNLRPPRWSTPIPAQAHMPLKAG